MLIPPSIVLVLYGILTEQSMGAFFIAGFIPGILEALFYIFTIYFLCKRNPFLLDRYIVLGVILLVYIALGCMMVSMAMMILTIHIVFLLILDQGFNPIWS